MLYNTWFNNNDVIIKDRGNCLKQSCFTVECLWNEVDFYNQKEWQKST